MRFMGLVPEGGSKVVRLEVGTSCDVSTHRGSRQSDAKYFLRSGK